jgi:hypothetical protein
MTPLEWLMNWYADQCDFANADPSAGGWEHHHGVTIRTLDNPGWLIEIDLAGTSLDGRHFPRQDHAAADPSDWWACWTADNKFRGAGGPRQLGAMIDVFRLWFKAQTAGYPKS